jgi:hypothetical protein
MNFSDARLKKTSDIFTDIAQVVFASIVIPFAIDKFNPKMILVGSVTCLLFWILSLVFVKERKK